MALFGFKKKTPQELMAAGNFKGAIKLFGEVLKKKGFDPGIAMQLANCHLKLGSIKEAKALFLKVGSHYGDNGFFNKAVAAFKKALTISPDDQAIFDKLAEYHGKVPQYMVDDRILQRASGFFQAPTEQELDAVDVHQEEPLPVAETPAVPEPETVSEPEMTGSSVEPGDASIDFEDFEGLDDLQDEITAEFERDAAAPIIGDDTIDTFGTDDFEDEEDSEESEARHPGEETQGSLAGVLDEVVDSGPSVPGEESKPKAVFTSREVEEPEDDSGGGFFDSLDDAIDTLFVSTSATSGSENDSMLDQRSWPLFRTMPRDVFLDFVMALDSHDFEPGQFIVRQGEDGAEMYLIAEGSVDVIIGETVVAQLDEGDFFGEASLLTRSPRNASCRAQTFTSCLALTRPHLETLAAAHPSVMDAIRSIYYTRIEQNAAHRQQGR